MNQALVKMQLIVYTQSDEIRFFQSRVSITQHAHVIQKSIVRELTHSNNGANNVRAQKKYSQKPCRWEILLLFLRIELWENYKSIYISLPSLSLLFLIKIQ